MAEGGGGTTKEFCSQGRTSSALGAVTVAGAALFIGKKTQQL